MLTVSTATLHVCVFSLFPTGDCVVVCVNNLGALSCLEMAVVTRSAIICLGKCVSVCVCEVSI